MKNKIITVTSLLVVMAAMTGMAAAELMSIAPARQDLSLSQTCDTGTYQTYTLSIKEIDIKHGANNHTIKATTGVVSGEGSNTDLKYKFITPGGNSTCKNSGETFSWNDGGLENATITLRVWNEGSAMNTDYKITVYDSYKLGKSTDDASGTVRGVSIPEFPIIAMPIAAVLLMVFIMHRRKKEE